MASVVLSADFVAACTGGQLVGSSSAVFDGVSTDSRTIRAGALFVALRGDRFDGHAFVADALARGAAGVLVNRDASSAGASASVTAILVDDTLTALQRLAREVRRQSGARVIAITGSAGKTTTKEVAAEFLSSRYRVFRNAGNLNNHIGLPLSLVELRHGPEIAVVELGMNHEGEIRELVRIAEPNVRVWTNVGDAHLGHFATRGAVAAAKSEILDDAASDTVAIANADDPLIVRHLAGWTGRRRLFGAAPHADVRVTHVADRGFAGVSADVMTWEGPLHLDVPLAGRAQLWNVLAATTIALEHGVSRDAIAARTPALSPVARRGQVHRLSNGVTVIDDSYNASPSAMLAMLDALGLTPTTGRRVAVLGEMLELGSHARALHDECGRAAARLGANALVVVGGRDADGLADGARAAGLAAADIHRFADSRAAADGTPSLLKAGDVVLVKGSRGTRMDLVVDRLKAVAG